MTGKLTVALSLLIVASAGYGFGSTVGEDIWRWAERKLVAIDAQAFTEGCISVLSNATNTDKSGELSEEELKTFALRAVQVKEVATQGDMLLVDVVIENLITGPIEYSLTLLSHASDSTTDWQLRSNRQVYDIVMLDKGEKRVYSLSDYFPSDRVPKRFWLEVKIDILGYWISVKRSFFFGSDASMTCPSSLSSSGQD